MNPYDDNDDHHDTPLARIRPRAPSEYVALAELSPSNRFEKTILDYLKSNTSRLEGVCLQNSDLMQLIQGVSEQVQELKEALVVKKEAKPTNTVGLTFRERAQRQYGPGGCPLGYTDPVPFGVSGEPRLDNEQATVRTPPGLGPRPEVAIDPMVQNIPEANRALLQQLKGSVMGMKETYGTRVTSSIEDAEKILELFDIFTNAYFQQIIPDPAHAIRGKMTLLRQDFKNRVWRDQDYYYNFLGTSDPDQALVTPDSELTSRIEHEKIKLKRKGRQQAKQRADEAAGDPF